MARFQPDSFMVAEVVPSPNHDQRVGGAPDMILLHYTGMQSGDAALRRLCATESKVSAHYLVFEDGRIVQCVPEERRAWHAGVSSWAGETDINSRSIGIEIVNPGHEFGYREFPLRQTAAVIALCKAILTRRGPIPPERVLAHSDVAPSRKQDPGERFPWQLLYDSGVGHWVRPAPLSVEGQTLRIGDEGDAVSRLQRTLAAYGYGIEPSGRFDDETRDVVTAFQRHFRQARVDGIADASTMRTLRALIETLPERGAPAASLHPEEQH
ncbi:MAG TPA: N-acetylmuramoyl-L-alanine amidase [Pseudolabrys sp.]|nr:N-acetylmuramoyl-L-alanine amidase [Pseudolabrys sp.]